MTGEWHALTTLGRRRRLRRVAVAALEAFGIRAEQMRALAYDTNAVFRVRAAGGRRLVLRVGRVGPTGHSAGQARSETEWLAAIAADAAVHAPVPLETASGARVVKISIDGVPGPRPCVAFEWIPGHLLAEERTPRRLEQYGALAAALHGHGASFVPQEAGSVPAYDEVFPYPEPVVLYGGDHPHFTPQRRGRFIAAAARVEAAISDLVAAEVPMQILHGDLHVWNVLVTRRGVAAIDFEDLLWGWPIQDIATSMYYLEGDTGFDHMLGAFRRGYSAVAPWPERYPGELETFIAGRALVLANDVILLERTGGLDIDPAAFFDRVDARLARLLPGL